MRSQVILKGEINKLMSKMRESGTRGYQKIDCCINIDL